MGTTFLGTTSIRDMFTRKHLDSDSKPSKARHVVVWTMTPPTNGPKPVPMEMEEKMTAIHLPRSRRGTRSHTIRL
ncbi:hypothetical protein EJ02DRAFT_460374, partial [Clathrospora elynae]